MSYRQWEPKRDRKSYIDYLRKIMEEKIERRPKMTEQERLDMMSHAREKYEQDGIYLSEMEEQRIKHIKERINQLKVQLKALTPARDGETWTNFETDNLVNTLKAVIDQKAACYARKKSAIAWKIVKLLIEDYELPFTMVSGH